MVQGVEVMSHWTGLDVYLPDGRKLGEVFDAVIDAESALYPSLCPKHPGGTGGRFPSVGRPLALDSCD